MVIIQNNHDFSFNEYLFFFFLFLSPSLLLSLPLPTRPEIDTWVFIDYIVAHFFSESENKVLEYILLFTDKSQSPYHNSVILVNDQNACKFNAIREVTQLLVSIAMIITVLSKSVASCHLVSEQKTTINESWNKGQRTSGSLNCYALRKC